VVKIFARRGITAVCCFLPLAAAGLAQAPLSDLVGTWNLESAELLAADGKPSPSPLGAGAQGVLVYDGSGRVAMQLMRPGTPPFVGNDRLAGTDAEVRAAFASFLAYYGTYTFDAKTRTVTHHIEGSSFPNWIGTAQVRQVEFEKDRLVLRSSSVTAGGATLAATYRWRRAETAVPAGAAAPVEKPGYRTLYLVRHGEYDRADARDDSVGKELVPIGVAQTRLLGARLRALPLRFTAFRASPLTRARQTAAVIADELPGTAFAIDPNLEECTPPTRRREAIADETAADLATCKARFERLVAEWLRPVAAGNRDDLLVAHGNVIRYLVTRALGVDDQAWLEMSIGHASLTVIRVEPDGRCKVIAVGDVGHLPPGLQTGTTGGAVRDLLVPAAKPSG
jgi:serine/threonine-protein phosphatase PGAM5